MSVSLDSRSAALSSLFVPAGVTMPAGRQTRPTPIRRATAKQASPARLAWVALTARVLAATVGNYAVTTLLTALLARILPTTAAEGSMTATLLSLAIFPTLVLTSFAVRSPWRLWAWMLATSFVLGGGVWLSLASGGRL
ncbi:hypothetical protein LK533_08975 [Sphingomonas sp. PL-96]|uniref:hypothetical protein n=1 Tax=Sphingomonas sp. PL-96 TaxID=2887201 RepID=UPI001E4E31A2|nr:hypothetical protein [Sphingomonas sp. PL-96]MCC2976804.1 hypothetical protein [Sphingomonas sp. PL-96]